MSNQKMIKDFTPVFAWGCDQFGQLGLGQKELNKSECDVRSTSFSVVLEEISCGNSHTLFLSRDGYVYAAGDNQKGQLGQGELICYSIPLLVASLKYCGGYHSAILTMKGEALLWGGNDYGQLGIGNFEQQNSPQNVLLNNNNENVVTYLSCGQNNTFMITKEQKVYGFGDGRYGQLGNNKIGVYNYPIEVCSEIQNIVSISSGEYCTLFINKSGQLFSSNINGSISQCNSIPEQQQSQQIQSSQSIVFVKAQVKQRMAAGLTQEGQIYLWGDGFFGSSQFPTKVKQITKEIIDFSLGNGLIILLDKNSRVYVWGNNNQGQLALGYTSNETSEQPIHLKQIRKAGVRRVFAGSSHLLALGEDWIHQSNNFEKKEFKKRCQFKGQDENCLDYPQKMQNQCLLNDQQKQQETPTSELPQQEQQFSLNPHNSLNQSYDGISLKEQSFLEQHNDPPTNSKNNASNRSFDRLSLDDSQIYDPVNYACLLSAAKQQNNQNEFKRGQDCFYLSNSQSHKKNKKRFPDLDSIDEKKQQLNRTVDDFDSNQNLKHTALLSQYLNKHNKNESPKYTITFEQNQITLDPSKHSYTIGDTSQKNNISNFHKTMNEKSLLDSSNMNDLSFLKKEYIKKGKDKGQLQLEYEYQQQEQKIQKTYKYNRLSRYEEIQTKLKRTQLEKEEFEEKLIYERRINRDLLAQANDYKRREQHLESKINNLKQELMSDRLTFQIELKQLNEKIQQLQNQDISSKRKLSINVTNSLNNQGILSELINLSNTNKATKHNYISNQYDSIRSSKYSPQNNIKNSSKIPSTNITTQGISSRTLQSQENYQFTAKSSSLTRNKQFLF